MKEQLNHQFPASIQEIQFGSLKIFAAVAPNVEKADDIKSRIECTGRRDIVKIPLDNNILVLTTDGLETYSAENPYKTGSPSDAVYLARRKNAQGEFLVQYLQPGQRTSHHRHPSSVEVYQKLSGSLLILRSAREVTKLETKTIIAQDEPHIIFTGSEPAITLILLFGENTNHVRLRRPSFKSLMNKAALERLI